MKKSLFLLILVLLLCMIMQPVVFASADDTQNNSATELPELRLIKLLHYSSNGSSPYTYVALAYKGNGWTLNYKGGTVFGGVWKYYIYTYDGTLTADEITFNFRNLKTDEIREFHCPNEQADVLELQEMGVCQIDEGLACPFMDNTRYKDGEIALRVKLWFFASDVSKEGDLIFFEDVPDEKLTLRTADGTLLQDALQKEGREIIIKYKTEIC